MLYIISFLASLATLIFWFSAQRKASTRLLFPKLFFGVFGLYLLTLFIQEATPGYKLMALSRDLLVLGGSAFLASIFLKKRYFYVAFLAIIGILIGKFYLPKLVNTFPQKIVIETDATSSSEIQYDENWELLVDLKEGAQVADLQDILKKYSLVDFEPAFQMQDKAFTDLDDFYVINIPEKHQNDLIEIINALESSEFVDYAEGNEVISVAPMRTTPLPEINRKFGINDPGLTHQWGFEALDVDKLYALLKEKDVKPVKKATIAILDTGVSGKHEDLKDRYTTTKPAYDVDMVGHGTHCAGIAGAVTNNNIGVASFSPNNSFVELTSIKVLNNSGGGTQRSVINGILEAADLKADVISMSLGGRSNASRKKAYTKAIKYAERKNSIVVVAAGNSNMNAKNYSPANTPGVITVSAIDTLMNKASFSNYVTDLDMGIAAPGVKIYSTVPTTRNKEKYAAFNGTSMACPHVAGLVGLMKSIEPDLKTKEVYKILEKTGRDTRQTRKTGKMIYPSEAIRVLLE